MGLIHANLLSGFEKGESRADEAEFAGYGGGSSTVKQAPLMATGRVMRMFGHPI